jgi:hypothetical protein
VPEVVVNVISNAVTVEENDQTVDVNVTEQVVDVTVGTSGPQGATGAAGAAGPAGPAGATGGSFTYNQTSPQTVWTVVHNLGYNPNVTTMDTANSVIEGNYNYVDINTLQISFNTATSGIAYLS